MGDGFELYSQIQWKSSRFASDEQIQSCWCNVLLSGGDGEEAAFIASCIEKYAEQVATFGYCLDAGDAQIFAEEKGVAISLLLDMPGSKIEVGSLYYYMSTLVPHIEEDDGEQLQRNDPENWLLLGVNARFDPTQQRNHWVPGWFREQLDPKVFKKLTETAWKAEEKEAKETKKKLAQLERQQPNNEEEAQDIAVQSESLKDSLDEPLR